MWSKPGEVTDRLSENTNELAVRFWGVRGSIACAGPETLKYGGNTSCLEVMCGDRRLILDAGSGLRYLGEKLKCDETLETDIFLSHSHMDHICGLPFFAPLSCTTSRIRLWSGHLENGWTTSRAIDELMTEPLFPVSKDVVFKAHVEFVDFDAGDTLRPATDVTVKTTPLNHPNGATGYRIEYNGKSLCYVTDTEHVPGKPDENILALIEGADIFIYDCSYTDEEYPQYAGFGHSTWQEGARLAEAAGVKTFVVFHHDPSHDDDAMDKIARELKKICPNAVVAQEGMVLES
jgi:phosphoribosyl 1,2-cyclic phosphodiesterase